MSHLETQNLKDYLLERRKRVDAALDSALPETPGPARDLYQAMRYSLFAGGKRLRPILCIAASESVGGDMEPVMPFACALELIHTYSLIHDDLPVMDDDDFRRGKPTNHKVFGEAMALLAGDALLTEAFRLMTSPAVSSRGTLQNVVSAIHVIAEAAGHGGMVGGQVVDIQSEGKSPDLPTVQFIHVHKTGALIAASVVSGAILAGGDPGQVASMTRYGQNIGLAFQISDDILDIEGDSQVMGKKTGADQMKGKMTYPSVVGLEESRRIQSRMIEAALQSLHSFDERAEPLRQLARYVIERNK